MFQPTVGFDGVYRFLFWALIIIYVNMILASLRYLKVTRHSPNEGGRDGMVE